MKAVNEAVPPKRVILGLDYQLTLLQSKYDGVLLVHDDVEVADLLDPPDGGYCYFDWDDLGTNRRLWLVYDKSGNTGLLDLPTDFALALGSAVEEAETVDAALAAVEDLVKTRRIQMEEAAAAAREMLARETADLTLKALGKYLRATEREVDAILKMSDQQRWHDGVIGQPMSCAEPLPRFTAVTMTNRGCAGVRPGGMVMGITTVDAVVEPDPLGYPHLDVVYSTRVVMT